TVAVACGYIVANHELGRYAQRALFEVRVIDNFQSPGPLSTEQIMADGLDQLNNKLSL
ncbi:MAG: hypothetical protein JWL89_618, partial [Candidatus Saccharibacteria bacterium]|nr:hypothetical protein [Candidatus Saccharibacteria bacterium]